MKSLNVSIYNFKEYSLKKKKLRKKRLIAFYNENFPLSRWSEKYFNTFLDDKNERRMECFVLEKNKTILGFILGRKVGNIRARYNLTTLLVDKNYREKGYSKLLLAAFLKTARKNKSTQKIYLHFRDSNNFEKFYQHYGFSGHRITGTYSNGEKKHYMEIKL
jgi:ribosomal protein S18 acetylase RimI-like enzyme